MSLKNQRAKASGFSLVEVVLALAVIGFALSAIFGMLVIAIGSGKDSTSDTLVAKMTDQVMSDLRRQYFVDNSLLPPGLTLKNHPAGQSNVLPGTDDVATGATPVAATSVIYFDSGGTLLASSTGAVYKCTETFQGDVSTLGPVGTDGSTAKQSVNLLNVTLVFAWPAQAASPVNSKTIYASIARY